MISITPDLELGGTYSSGAVSARHLGANYLFNRESFREGVGEEGGFDEVAQQLGLAHLRYPGGTMAERQFDLSNPENTFQSTDLITGAPITNSNQHALTPLSAFLDYADTVSAKVSIVLPTAQYRAAILSGDLLVLAAVEAEVTAFVTNVLTGADGHTVEAFEIGNEYAGIGFTSPAEYGLVADQMITWVQRAIDTAATGNDPTIAIQASARSAFPNESQAIAARLSPESLAAIDAVIIHNYRPTPWDQQPTTAGKFDHVAVFETFAGRPLESFVTEWDVGNASPNDGLLQAAGILDMFSQMLREGMDLGHIWPVLENNTTRLAGNVTDLSEPADLMIAGEVFRQMSESLPGLSALNFSPLVDHDEGGTDLLVHGFGSADRAVVFVSSLRATDQKLVLDLSRLAGIATQADGLTITRTGVADGVDPISPASLPLVSLTEHAGQSALSMPLDLDLGAYEILRLEFGASTVVGLEISDSQGFDNIRLGVEAETIRLTADGTRDLVRNFDVGADRLDVSALAADSFEDLSVTNILRRDGSVNWIEIAADTAELWLRVLPDQALDASALSAEHFIFALPGTAQPVQIQQDAAGFTKLTGTAGADVFALLDDDSVDQLKVFDPARDQIDVSALADSFDEITLRNHFRGDGSVSWVSVTDEGGVIEALVRFATPVETDVTALSADNFIFG